jgi:GTPase SAR1 family protein
MSHLKICVVGPKGCGKSVISNFLAGQAGGLVEGPYSPTAGVRILEYEANIPRTSQPVNVELWDASGDHSYVFFLYFIYHR